jgi:hypothetical protein
LEEINCNKQSGSDWIRNNPNTARKKAGLGAGTGRRPRDVATDRVYDLFCIIGAVHPSVMGLAGWNCDNSHIQKTSILICYKY